MKYIKTCIAVFLLSYIPLALSEVHKWKDDDGKVHYGDRPEIVGTPVIKADKPSDDHDKNARRLRSQTNNVMNDIARENAEGERNKRQLNMEYRMQSEREQREEAQRYRTLNRGR